MRELMFKISKALLITVGIVQLGISQIYIEMITKLFARPIGFYLFIFIISGLLIVFNVSSMTINNSGKVKQFILTFLLAVGSGVYFMNLAWKDYLNQESVVLGDVQLSLILVAIGIIIYVVASIGILVSYLIHSERLSVR